MKWDVKHDRAKKIISAFLDNAGYWEERTDLAEGMTDEDKAQVNEELALMIASITKRYKLDVQLPAQEATKGKEDPEVKEEKPKKQRKSRTKKVKETEQEVQE